MSIVLDQHTLIQEVKALAIELDRAPLREEFEARVPKTRNLIRKLFGGYGLLLIAAGIKGAPEDRQKIDNSIFEKNIEQHLEAYSPKKIPKLDPWPRTLFIGDTHFPFIHKPTLEQIYAFCELMKPELVVQVGDLYDAYSHAKFARSHNVFTPRDEHSAGRRMAEEMWAKIRSIVPNARCIQVLGNHDVRPMRRILEVYPEAEDWISEILRKTMSFEGVETIMDIREELILPGQVMVIHGYRSKLGEHRDHTLMNAVCGHQHVGGVVFKNFHGIGVRWELNCGLVGDPQAKGLSYTPQKITNWTLGWGWLDEHGPRFIPAKA